MQLDRKFIAKSRLLSAQSKPKGMYRNNITYAFTFNFNDKYQYFDENDVHRLSKIYLAVKKVDALLRRVCSYELYPEFSTPESFKCVSFKKAPRYHFHGTIIFKDVGYFYYQIFRKLLTYGIFDIDTIKDRKVWNNYIYKDRDVMEPFLREYKIPYTWDKKFRKRYSGWTLVKTLRHTV